MQIRRVALVGLHLILHTVLCLAGQRTATKESIDSFLEAWLVRKDFPQVEQAFAEDAFTNDRILSEDCAGYIGPEDRHNPSKIRQGVMQFLKEISDHADGGSLKEILKFDATVNEQRNRTQTLARPSEEGYALIQAQELRLQSQQDWKYLKSRFPSPYYLELFLFVKTKDGKDIAEVPIYLIWGNQRGNWRIIHLGMHCI